MDMTTIHTSIATISWSKSSMWILDLLEPCLLYALIDDLFKPLIKRPSEKIGVGILVEWLIDNHPDVVI